VVTLTKHMTLMYLQDDSPLSDADAVPWRRFANEPEEGEVGVCENVIIARDCWADMGSPDVVTVSVEPGDLLNE
jgi:hypothetical protein